MDWGVFVSSGVVAAIVGALMGSGLTIWMQRRKDATLHRTAAAAVLAELAAVLHVVNLMLSNQSVMQLPGWGDAFRSMTADVLRGLSANDAEAVVLAYAHLPLLDEAVRGAAERGKQMQTHTTPGSLLQPPYAKSIELRAEEIRTAVSALRKHLRRRDTSQ